MLMALTGPMLLTNMSVWITVGFTERQEKTEMKRKYFLTSNISSLSVDTSAAFQSLRGNFDFQNCQKEWLFIHESQHLKPARRSWRFWITKHKELKTRWKSNGNLTSFRGYHFKKSFLHSKSSINNKPNKNHWKQRLYYWSNWRTITNPNPATEQVRERANGTRKDFCLGAETRGVVILKLKTLQVEESWLQERQNSCSIERFGRKRLNFLICQVSQQTLMHL